jgi:hypothetical protein
MYTCLQVHVVSSETVSKTGVYPNQGVGRLRSSIFTLSIHPSIRPGENGDREQQPQTNVTISRSPRQTNATNDTHTHTHMGPPGGRMVVGSLSTPRVPRFAAQSRRKFRLLCGFLAKVKEDGAQKVRTFAW